jgi:hypothetical protein
VNDILSSGLDETDYEDPYKIYSSVQDARDSLFKDLAATGHQRSSNLGKPTDYTLIAIASDYMEMNNNVFYTRKLHGHRQGSRSYGYFYTGFVKPQGLSVSKLNKTTL